MGAGHVARIRDLDAQGVVPHSYGLAARRAGRLTDRWWSGQLC